MQRGDISELSTIISPVDNMQTSNLRVNDGKPSRRVGARKGQRQINSTFAEHVLVRQWQKEEGFIDSGISIGFENRKSVNPFQESIFSRYDSVNEVLLSKTVKQRSTVFKAGEQNLLRNDRALLKKYKFDADIIGGYEELLLSHLKESFANYDYEIVDGDDSSSSSDCEDYVFVKADKEKAKFESLVMEIQDSILRSVLHSLCRFYGLHSKTVGNSEKKTLITIPDKYLDNVGLYDFFPKKSFCEMLSWS
jgi:hypothetical protein